MLDKIRNRENHSEVDVTPELAARVIKEYLLPMFEADTRNVHAKNRAHQFGISPREDSEYKVNESNLLSERLMAELTKT